MFFSLFSFALYSFRLTPASSIDTLEQVDDDDDVVVVVVIIIILTSRDRISQLFEMSIFLFLTISSS